MPSIEVKQTEDMLFETELGNHTIKMDVPKEWGGQDRAPMASQLFLASIAACSAVFIAKYCKTVDIDSKNLRITMDYEKIENYFGNFKIKIHLPEALKKQDAVLRAAQHCTVHDSIKNFKGIEYIFE